MWLLNTETRRLELFDDNRLGGTIYAILSHTWGEEEVTFSALDDKNVEELRGYAKIRSACDQALEDDIQWIWIDTCCIDKRSSAELSEAINSMYQWYYNAQICYAYLEDEVLMEHWHYEPRGTDELPRCLAVKHLLPRCRWFTRGWTLQELIAPHTVRFFDKAWNFLWEKSKVAGILSSVTNISVQVLTDRDALKWTTIAERMSWASMRQTTRLEDRSYSLLGLFGVNLPLLYGEGNKAFQRLQEEIIRTSGSMEKDQSLFAWSSSHGSLLALSPSVFADGHLIRYCQLSYDEGFEMTSNGLRICAFVRSDDPVPEGDSHAKPTYDNITIALNCTYSEVRSFHDRQVAIKLRRRPRVHRLGLHLKESAHTFADNLYDKLPSTSLQLIDAATLKGFVPMEVLISRTPFDWTNMANKISLSSDEKVIRMARPSRSYTVERGDMIIDMPNGKDDSICKVSLQPRRETGPEPIITFAVNLDRRRHPPQVTILELDEDDFDADEEREAQIVHAVEQYGERVTENEGYVLSYGDVDFVHLWPRFVFQRDKIMLNLEFARPVVKVSAPVSPLHSHRSMELTALASSTNLNPHQEGNQALNPLALGSSLVRPAYTQNPWSELESLATLNAPAYWGPATSLKPPLADTRRSASAGHGSRTFSRFRKALKNLFRHDSAPTRRTGPAELHGDSVIAPGPVFELAANDENHDATATFTVPTVRDVEKHDSAATFTIPKVPIEIDTIDRQPEEASTASLALTVLTSATDVGSEATPTPLESTVVPTTDLLTRSVVSNLRRPRLSLTTSLRKTIRDRPILVTDLEQYESQDDTSSLSSMAKMTRLQNDKRNSDEATPTEQWIKDQADPPRESMSSRLAQEVLVQIMMRIDSPRDLLSTILICKGMYTSFQREKDVILSTVLKSGKRADASSREKHGTIPNRVQEFLPEESTAQLRDVYGRAAMQTDNASLYSFESGDDLPYTARELLPTMQSVRA